MHQRSAMASRAKRSSETRRASGQRTAPDLWKRGKWWLLGSGAAAAIVLLVVLTSALSGPEATGGERLTSPEAVPEQFDFQVSLYQGWQEVGSRELSFASLLGDKPIVLNYWASACPPCAAEMPEFQKVYKAYKGRVLFFGLDVGRFAGLGGPDESVMELGRLGVTYPAAPVPDIETVQRLRVRGLPSTDFITPEGKVIRNWTGILNESKLTELVEDLLNAS